MIFTQNRSTETTSLSKVQKDIKELQTQVEDNAQEITNVDEDLQSYKNIVALQQSEQNTTINTVNDKVTNLQSYTEGYVEQNKELIETQVLRASEYVESPLGRFVNLEVSGNITGGDFDDVKDDITSLQNALEETNGNVQTNADNIETLNNKQSVTEQKVDTILEQGEIPITTDEVQLGNAYINENGNSFYGRVDLTQDDDYKPVAGAVYTSNKSHIFNMICVKSNATGYTVLPIYKIDGDTPISTFLEQVEMSHNIFTQYRNKELYPQALEIINNTGVSSYIDLPIVVYSGDTVVLANGNEKINSGLISDISLITDEDISQFTFYNVQDAYYVVTTSKKIYEVVNGVATDVTETITTIPNNSIILLGKIDCKYKNYYVGKVNGFFFYESENEMLCQVAYLSHFVTKEELETEYYKVPVKYRYWQLNAQ